MSGVYIQMEMPENCQKCQMLSGYDAMDGFCHAANKWLDDDFFRWYQYEEGDVDDGQPLNCPLIAVPDHGRLIDADIPEDDRQVYGFFYDYDLQQFLDSRKTIIPAEEGE